MKSNRTKSTIFRGVAVCIAVAFAFYGSVPTATAVTTLAPPVAGMTTAHDPDDAEVADEDEADEVQVDNSGEGNAEDRPAAEEADDDADKADEDKADEDKADEVQVDNSGSGNAEDRGEKA